MKKTDNLNIIQLNELNFDIVQKYVDSGLPLPSFSKLLPGLKTTKSEEIYENLEPWIQWPSFYTGRNLDGHGVFRLGDYNSFTGRDLLGEWANQKKKIVAIAPMNLSNTTGNNDTFLPDPWTDTHSSGNLYVKWLSGSIKDFVNNNSSGRVSIPSKLKLIFGLTYFLSFKEIRKLLHYYKKIKNVKFRKAIFLDYALVSIYTAIIKKHKDELRGLLFLNAGAHIQHHYFFNSKHTINNDLKNPEWYISDSLDPLGEVLIAYDEMLAPLLEEGQNTLVVTGLSQDPYIMVKHYYRLLDHKNFLSIHQIKYQDVQPRMTRDFEIFFDNEAEKISSMATLQSFCDQNGVRVFGEMEERDGSLFVTSTYPNSMSENTFFKGGLEIDLDESFVFVAIKNGMHNQVGYWSAVGMRDEFKDWDIEYIWDFFAYLKA